MDGDLRLVNGGTQFEGRLEVCLGDQWGTICDDYWKSNPLNAQVACRQLGFSNQSTTFRKFANIIYSKHKIITPRACKAIGDLLFSDSFTLLHAGSITTPTN